MKRMDFETPSGKVELYSDRLDAWGFDPLPIWHEPPETPESRPDLVDEYPFILMSWKSAPFRHSGGRQINPLRQEHPDPMVHIHPRNSRKRGYP